VPGEEDGGRDDPRRAEIPRLARTIFSVLYLHTVRLYLGMDDPDALPDALRGDVGPLVEQFLAVPQRPDDRP